jgi:RNA polymerase sigma-70 factor (ECF subfamily)
MIKMTELSEIKNYNWLAEHGDYLYRFALARLRDPSKAEDVVQDTFLAAIQNSNFSGLSSRRTWLIGILKHKIIDLMRKQIKEPSQEYVDEFQQVKIDDADMDDFFTEKGAWSDKPQLWTKPDGQLEQKQFFETLQNCMDKLPKKLVAIFTLRDIEEEDNEKICKELEITPTNAWVMLYRARMSLRKCLEFNWMGS